MVNGIHDTYMLGHEFILENVSLLVMMRLEVETTVCFLSKKLFYFLSKKFYESIEHEDVR